MAHCGTRFSAVCRHAEPLGHAGQSAMGREGHRLGLAPDLSSLASNDHHTALFGYHISVFHPAKRNSTNRVELFIRGFGGIDSCDPCSFRSTATARPHARATST